ncbi:DUF4129 domain-containing protein [Halosimplex sp. J119]
MQRLGTALVAVLAVVALAGAAGTFDAVEGPSIAADGTPSGRATVTDVPPPTNAPVGSNESGFRQTPPETPAGAASDGGGVSPLVVPAVTGSVLAGGLLVVLLTGNDERAPDLPVDGDDFGVEDPVPAVDPDYETTRENAVVAAWRDLRDRVDADETATPGDVAARAVKRRLPGDAVSTVTDRFRDVRYGDETPTEGAVADAETAAERLDEAAETVDGDPEPTRTDSAEQPPSDGR